jgi:hypothetical protein
MPAWPASEVLTHRPGWPVDPEVPAARQSTGRMWPAQLGPRSAPAAPPPAWPTEADAMTGAPETPTGPAHAWPDGPTREAGAHARAGDAVPVALRRPGTRAKHAAAPPPKRKMISADMVLDTVPLGPVRAEAVVYSLPETTATGLRKFDLGNVPASVTPPRSWRKAAWFAVGTSAAVVLGLSIAAVELMGRPVSDGTLIDAMPVYPTGPLTLERLPNEETTTDPSGTKKATPPSPKPSVSHPRAPEDQTSQDGPRDTVIGSSAGGQTSDDPTSQDMTSTTPQEPYRTTVGPAPVTPTDPTAMGDRTEEYFKLVTSDPTAAHAMTTGGMAREGAEGIEARYAGVERVEVQDITIDRNQAVTTSTIKIVHEDGTETIEHRQLTFTWGGDPKITDEATTA